MFDNYVKVAVATPGIRVADCNYNVQQIRHLMERASDEKISLLCLPQLCITGATCGDLMFQERLIESARNAFYRLVDTTQYYDVMTVLGVSGLSDDDNHDTVAIIKKGHILATVPHFATATNLFRCDEKPNFSFSVRLSHNTQIIPDTAIIVHLAADNELIGSADYRHTIIKGESRRFACGYLYANAGYGESTTNTVFSGHNLIYENGTLLSESKPFGKGWAVSELDLTAIQHKKRQNAIEKFEKSEKSEKTEKIKTTYFTMDFACTALTRHVSVTPFVPTEPAKLQARCEEVLNIQTMALLKRLNHTKAATIVVGVSGGLDSTLALLVAKKVAQLKKPVSNILAITMPCFGTTSRTRNNAHRLCQSLKIRCCEIDITESVKRHLADINHPPDIADVTFENAQARMRTMVLMDLANQNNGIVLGTGDLSELALGFSTYNGDHMSMYSINLGVPKTLISCIIKYIADTQLELTDVLNDIIDTPISPELLPVNSPNQPEKPEKSGKSGKPEKSAVVQSTEDILGPYELHDFFLYHMIGKGHSPKTILELACYAFSGKYHRDELKTVLKTFYTRFFSQQFKRNCSPDGPKIGSVSLSPHGDWEMPSDAMSAVWLNELS